MATNQAVTVEETSASPRVKAAIRLAQHLATKFGGDLRDNLAAYLGFTSGDHILRDQKGRVWSVDLVTGKCLLCVGLLPSQWKHPPRIAA